jgi:hypothetical protein
MRIAYLNVWDGNSAEAHAGISLKNAAAAAGAEVIPCRNSAEVEACGADFALVFSRTQSKFTRCATYLAINEPASVYLREPGLLPALYSFDGYFSMAHTLERFLDHALYGIGRKEPVGLYYNTAPKYHGDSEPVKKALFSGAGKLTYFGTNWDGRRNQFFRQLGATGLAEFYGPREKWLPFNNPAYQGEVTFDGLAVMEKYRHNAIGLNVQGDHHVREDVISNRIFEITAVGAVGVTCRMPWLEKHYGDSLYYFEQETSDKRLVEQIGQILAHIKAHPEEAWEKAQKARRVFEENFTLEILLKNTIDYHKKRQKKFTAAAREKAPLVSVVICSDGKNPARLQRALASITAQDAGRFQVVLVKTAPFAHASMVRDTAAAYVKVDAIDATPGATPLWQGLAKAKGDYIALLDEAHEWFPQHIHRLLEAAGDDDEAFVHGALLQQGDQPAAETAWIKNNELRRITHQIDVKGKDIRTAYELISPCSFLAGKDLFDDRLLEDPGFATGAVEYLMMSLIGRAKPRQTFASTTLFHIKDRVAPVTSPEERTEIMLRLWRENPQTGGTNNFIEEIPAIGFRMRAWRYETQREEKNGVLCDSVKSSRFDPARLQRISMPWVKEQSFFHMGLNLIDDQNFALSIATGETQRGLAGFVAFPQMEEGFPIEYLLVLEAEVEKGQFGVQLLHNERTLERYSVARLFTAGKRYRLELPVYYRPEISGLVVEVHPGTVGRIRSLTAFAES